MNILITSGGTKVPIDAVRSITNSSSGRTGADLARELLKRGHNIFFLSAVRSEHPFIRKIDTQRRDEYIQAIEDVVIRGAEFEKNKANFYSSYYKTFDEYKAQVENILEHCDIEVAVMAAAVSDYGMEAMTGKVSGASKMTLHLEPLPKILDRVKEVSPNTKLVAFKMLFGSTPEQLDAAANKVIEHSKADMVIGNDLSEIKEGKQQFTFFYPKKEIYGPYSDFLSQRAATQIESL